MDSIRWYNYTAILDYTIKELADIVLKRGGHINKYYLQERNKNKHTVIFLNGWFAGKNVREALLKALA